MNRFQKIVLCGGALNLLLLLLFPPYDLIGLGRGAPMFDAFYPMFAAPPNRVINGDVLYLLVFGVLINAVLAWLLLASPPTRDLKGAGGRSAGVQRQAEAYCGGAMTIPRANRLSMAPVE